MKKSFFVLMLIVVACSKDVDSSTEVNNTTQESPTEQQSDNSNNQDNNNSQNNQNTNTPVPFTSRSERYSAINETTGYFNNQNNFYKYTNDSIARSLKYTKEECTNYIFTTSDQVTYDFNNDGFLDSVVFQYYSNPCQDAFTHGTRPGVFAVYNNFFNENNVQYFDTELRWVAGDLELNDTNGDGDFEIILWNYNRHESQDFPLLDITILDIDRDLNVTENQLDFTGFDFHNGSSGDIDNDGDIDLIKWSIVGECCNGDRSQALPKLLINDGTGSFSEIPLLENEVEFFENYYGGWRSTTSELFDLNNDGYLDIIVGYYFGKFVNESDDLNGDIYILWGSNSGIFDFNNMTIIEDSNYLNLSQIYLGTLFTDYDNDGDIDLIITSTSNYSQYIINIFQNNGDKTFNDVTQEKCNQCFGENFTHFYRFYSIDKDNDGDFDLVPGDVGTWDNEDYFDNLYWENVGGRFEKREYN